LRDGRVPEGVFAQLCSLKPEPWGDAVKRIRGLDYIAGPPAIPPTVGRRRHCPDTRPVTPTSPAAERRGREDVHARLARRFPAVPAHELERIVTEEFDSFDGARVRHYVPVLVLRRAGERLSRIGQPGAAPAETEGDAGKGGRPS
jgi:hypothetical protein